MNGWTLGPKKLWAQKTFVRQRPRGNRGSGVPAQAEDQNQVQCTGASRSPHSFRPWSAPLGEDRETSHGKTRLWTGPRKRQNYRERSRQWQGERRKYQKKQEDFTPDENVIENEKNSTLRSFVHFKMHEHCKTHTYKKLRTKNRQIQTE